MAEQEAIAEIVEVALILAQIVAALLVLDCLEMVVVELRANMYFWPAQMVVLDGTVPTVQTVVRTADSMDLFDVEALVLAAFFSAV